MISHMTSHVRRRQKTGFSIRFGRVRQERTKDSPLSIGHFLCQTYSLCLRIKSSFQYANLVKHNYGHLDCSGWTIVVFYSFHVTKEKLNSLSVLPSIWHLSVSICLSVDPSSIDLFVCLFICLAIYPSTPH